MHRPVTFRNRTWDVAATLELPPGFDEARTYAAIVCVHPGSSVKEQTAGLYARKLADQGFVALVLDASFQGASGGEPRHLEDPATRVEDVRCAVDHLTTLGFVDADRIGVLGVCAGGGYAVNAAMTEHRIRAVGAVVAINIGAAHRERDALATLAQVGAQRTAEARGAPPRLDPWIPDTVDAMKQAGITERDVVEAVTYYRTPRGQHPRSDNRLRFTSLGAVLAFDAFHLVETLLTQPLQLVMGDVVGAFNSPKHGRELFERATGDKALHIVKGASHYDLYDQPGPVAEALAQLVPFYRKHLGA